MVTQWVNQAAINRSQLATARIALPPITEQRRIVEILEQADVLRRRRAEADQKADRILLALFYRMFGDPATWETHGSTEPLGKLIDLQGGGTPSKSNPTYWGGDIPWVSPKDMKRDFIDDAEDHITQLALDDTNSRIMPINSILIVVRGMILARYVPVAVTVAPVTINQDMKALVLVDERLSALYLFAAMKALGQRLQASVATAAHGTRKLDTDVLISLPILVPGKKQHADFVTRFNQIREYDKKRTVARTRLECLFDVLLHRAFTGDLTAKWREAHMKELLAEMEAQTKALASTA
jgi:type I restriction enzyme S subunit